MRLWTRILVVLAVALALSASQGAALGGYSSGKSSVSRSSSSSSGRSSSSSSSSSSSARSSSSYSSGKGSSYSSGKGESYSSGKGYSNSPSSSSPGTGSFGASAASAQRRVESGSSSASTNRPAYVAPRPVTPRDQQIAYLRGQLNAQRYAERESRQQSFYVGYYGRPYGVSYSDGYSPWFWLWLLDRPQDQATWCYHHRYTMDQARYNALLNENADLRAQVEQLETQNVPRNPTYVPPDLPEADLMYTDAYVAAATQPAEAPAGSGGDFDPQANAGDAGVPGPNVSGNTSAVAAVSSSHGSSWASMCSGFSCVGALAIGVLGICWLTSRRSSSSAMAGYALPVRPPAPAPPPLPRAAFVPAAPAQGPYNPLNLRIGGSFDLDCADGPSGSFTVRDILQYTAMVGGQPFTFVSYQGDSAGEPRAVELRVERITDQQFAVVALRLHDELDYSQEFYNIVATDGTGRFQITDDATGQVTAEYFRPAGVFAAYSASVTAASGKALSRIQYWDYSRKLTYPDGREVNEYLIVEMDEAGHFRILIGPQVDPKAVQVR